MTVTNHQVNYLISKEEKMVNVTSNKHRAPNSVAKIPSNNWSIAQH